MGGCKEPQCMQLSCFKKDGTTSKMNDGAGEPGPKKRDDMVQMLPK